MAGPPPSSPADPVGRIKAEALRLGASRVGICAARELDRGRVFLQWLQAGHHAEMGWLARGPERRSDPRRLLDGARSCLVVAVDHPRRRPDRGAGKVARYASGRDYHDVVGEILKGLESFLDREYGARSRSWVDTGPVLERELAMAAGLGFIGKNTNLIHKRAGSYFFIGEVVTDLELPADPPSTPHCGTCTACLDACPTEAFVAPYVLDSRRCISYWTIEHRGFMPRTMQARLEGWAFGCDVCQEVCPWNRKPRTTPHPDLVSPEGVDLEAAAILDDEAFRDRYRGTVFWRPRRAGLARNVCAAAEGAGGAGERTMRRGLTDDRAEVRAQAAAGLGRLAWRRARRERAGAGGARKSAAGSGNL